MKRYLLIVFLPSLLGVVIASILERYEHKSFEDYMYNTTSLSEYLAYGLITYFMIGTGVAIYKALVKMADTVINILPETGTAIGEKVKGIQEKQVRKNSEKELYRLKKLYDDNIITRDEYEKKAKKLKKDIL